MQTLYKAVIFFALFYFQTSAFGQPFKLVKDINGGILYDMPRPVNLVESGRSVFFRVGYPSTSNKNRGPQEGFWKSDESGLGTIHIKGLSASEMMETLNKN